MSELISVLMGVYNAEDTLKDAINSIVCQTYPHWELIICDDGSTDNSYNIACSYQDERIIVIRNDCNRGLGYTLNRCFERAKGSLIARMDADDISVKDRLEKEVAYLNANHDCDVVSSAISFFDDSGVIKTTQVIDCPKAADFIAGAPVAHAACLMRRACLEKVGGYNEGRNTLRLEDVDLWHRFLQEGYRFCNIPEPLYLQRFDMQSIKRQTLSERWRGLFMSFKACRTFHLSLKYYIYALRSPLGGFIPAFLRYRIHLKRMKK